MKIVKANVAKAGGKFLSVASSTERYGRPGEACTERFFLFDGEEEASPSFDSPEEAEAVIEEIWGGAEWGLEFIDPQ